MYDTRNVRQTLGEDIRFSEYRIHILEEAGEQPALIATLIERIKRDEAIIHCLDIEDERKAA